MAEPDEERRLLMGTRGWEAEWLEVGPEQTQPQLGQTTAAKLAKL